MIMNTKLYRRIEDNVVTKNPSHRLNLDRRFKMNERRNLNSNYNYIGPVRRFTIDRRLGIGDRRAVDD